MQMCDAYFQLCVCVRVCVCVWKIAIIIIMFKSILEKKNPDKLAASY